VISLVHSATGTWALPSGSFVLGFAPLPAESEARVILASTGRDAALFAVGEELQRYEISTGRLIAGAPGPGGMIDDLGWTENGEWIVAAAGGKAYVLGASGKVTRELPVEGRALHVAIEARGASAAVASDVGNVSIVDFARDSTPRSVSPSLQPVSGLAFAGALLWVAGSDGTLRALDPASGAERARVDVGSPLVDLAIAPDGKQAATVARDHVIRVHALPGGDVVATLAWHQARIATLGWGAGPTLVSGDTDGALAVWDPAPAP
jgi:WD40 repeat protein